MVTKRDTAPRVCRAASRAATAKRVDVRLYYLSPSLGSEATCRGLHEQTRRGRWRPRTRLATNDGETEARAGGLALDRHCAFLRAWQRRLCFLSLPLLDALITTSITYTTTTGRRATTYSLHYYTYHLSPVSRPRHITIILRHTRLLPQRAGCPTPRLIRAHQLLHNARKEGRLRMLPLREAA